MTTTDHPALDAPFGNPPALTMLDGLMSDLDEHPALNDTVDLPIELRPGWEVRCSTDIPYENLAAWRKAAQDASMGNGTNEIKLGCAILVFACKAVLVDGEPIMLDGQPVTFATEQLQAKLGVTRPADAVRKMFLRDGFITAASTALIGEAGYGTQATPTRR